MIDSIFYWCVDFLRFWATRLGMTYEEINVYLFVFILPVLLVIQSTVIAALLVRRK